MTHLIEYADRVRVTITDAVDDRAVFAVTASGMTVCTAADRLAEADTTATLGPATFIEPADFLALLRVAVENVDGMAAGVADVLAAHHATPETIPVPVTATAPTKPATRLYAVESGGVAEVGPMDDGNGLMIVWWGSREDFDADRAEQGPGDDAWSDRATASAVVDTEDEVHAELGHGAKLLIGADA